jgi:hypothetical protein
VNESDKQRAEKIQKRAWLIALVLVGLVGVPFLIAVGATSSMPRATLVTAASYVIVFSIFRWGTLPIFRAVLGPEETTSPAEEQETPK